MEITIEREQDKSYDITYLNPAQSCFYETEGRMLAVKVGEKEYPRVQLHRSFPHSSPDSFVSVRDPDNKEIGIIRELSDFNGNTLTLLRHHLDIRYFSPVITKVVNVKDEFGYTFWDVETGDGSCHFVVRKDGKSIVSLPGGKAMVIDVDGNRFSIPCLEALTKKEMNMIEIYL
ncbi:MAG: hypothetical protein BGN88_06470 [Clostridiales bacterium 43-6]|nr:MAG: hypothetical protein BGN88_06470 [Clostridiales bacterium 43-6]